VPAPPPVPAGLVKIRRDSAARGIVLAWRRLTSPGAEPTGGRPRPPRASPTLVACSGGADSSALVIALASAAKPGQLTVAHVVHDMRPAEQALADRDAVRDLAAMLDLPFAEAHISVQPHKGNTEAIARRLRYRALAAMAAERGIRFIATAHHAGDQTESLLMALLRGSGPRGLAGIARTRRLDAASDIRLIRPMLHASRADAERICTLAGWAWREDATNTDTTRLRAALRHGPARDLVALRPGGEKRIARTAQVLRDLAGLVHDRAAALLNESIVDRGVSLTWPRNLLRQERAVVVTETLRLGAATLLGGRRLDRITGRLLDPAVEAVRDGSTAPRTFCWPGLTLRITSRTVTLAAAPSAGATDHV